MWLDAKHFCSLVGSHRSSDVDRPIVVCPATIHSSRYVPIIVKIKSTCNSSSAESREGADHAAG